MSQKAISKIREKIKEVRSLADLVNMTFDQLILFFIEQTMQLELDEELGYQNGDRKAKPDDNKRNGYRTVKADGKFSKLEFRVPRDRFGVFKPLVLEVVRSQEEREKRDALVLSLFHHGLTTRDVQEIYQEMFGSGYSRTSVSRIASGFTKVRDEWLKRPLDDRFVAIYIDAVFIPVRRGSAEKEAFYIVLGLREDMRREVLGVYNFPTESASAWEVALNDIKGRGVKDVLLFVGDGLKELDTAVKKVYPFADFQGCTVHKKRNVLLRIGSEYKKAVAEDLKNVFRTGDRNYNVDDGLKELAAFVAKWGKLYPKVKSAFDSGKEELLFTYTKYPPKMQSMIYTTNWIENTNRWVKRTTKIRGCFPNEDSATNLVCAAVMGLHEGNFLKYPVTTLYPVQTDLIAMLDERTKMRLDFENGLKGCR